MKRVPFSEPLWKPEPYLGPSGMDARDSLVLAVDRMERERALGIRLRPSDGEEFRPGYLAQVRERICPPPAQEEPTAEPMRALYKIVEGRR